MPASLRWESNSLIFAKSKAAHFKEAGLLENHTQSQQQRKGRGNSLITPAFLLASGRFNRNLGWMDDVRAGVQGLFRVWLSYLQRPIVSWMLLRLRPRTASVW